MDSAESDSSRTVGESFVSALERLECERYPAKAGPEGFDRMCILFDTSR